MTTCTHLDQIRTSLQRRTDVSAALPQVIHGCTYVCA
jgi:hypothetical protein